MHNNEKYYYGSVDDTIKYGVVQAIILGRIRWWCQYNEEQKDKDKFHDGYYWSGWMTGKDFEEQTGIPDSTIYRNLNELIDKKIILRERFNKMKRDKSGWYRINPNPQNGNTISQNENTNPQNGTSNSQNENTLPVNLPINQSENLSENILHHNTGANTQKKKRKDINNMLIELMNSLEYYNSNKDRLGILVQFLRDCKTEMIEKQNPKQLTERQLFLINELIGNTSFKLSNDEIANKVEKLIPLLNVKVQV